MGLENPLKSRLFSNKLFLHWNCYFVVVNGSTLTDLSISQLYHCFYPKVFMPSTGTLHKCWRRPFTVKTCLDPWAESKLLTIISTGDFQICHSAPFNTSIFPLASSADRKRDAHKRRGTRVQAAEKKAAWEIGLRNENSPRDRHWKSTARDMGTAQGKAGGRKQR